MHELIYLWALLKVFRLRYLWGTWKENRAWIIIQLNYSKVKTLVQIKAGCVSNRSLDWVFYLVIPNRGTSSNAYTVTSPSSIFFESQKPDVPRNQSARDNTVCSVSCRVSRSLRFLSTQKEDDWQRRPRRDKNPSMDFRVLLLGPICPHFHSLFLPNQFFAGTLLTQVNGVVIQQSMSVSARRIEGCRHTGSRQH